MAGDRDKALSAGCSDHISKPIDRRILVNTIADLIGQRTKLQTQLDSASLD